jgi:hypothetical protein
MIMRRGEFVSLMQVRGEREYESLLVLLPTMCPVCVLYIYCTTSTASNQQQHAASFLPSNLRTEELVNDENQNKREQKGRVRLDKIEYAVSYIQEGACHEGVLGIDRGGTLLSSINPSIITLSRSLKILFISSPLLSSSLLPHTSFSPLLIFLLLLNSRNNFKPGNNNAERASLQQNRERKKKIKGKNTAATAANRCMSI